MNNKENHKINRQTALTNIRVLCTKLTAVSMDIILLAQTEQDNI